MPTKKSYLIDMDGVLVRGRTMIPGAESGMETILVLSGVTREEEVRRYSFQPTRMLPSAADIDP